MTDLRRKVPYTQSSSSQDVPPPYFFPNVTANTFIWKVQMEMVQAYCDTFLNLGSSEERDFEYRPLAAWPYAILMFLEYPEMISSNPAPEDIGEVPYPQRGETSQNEVFVAIPVVRYGTGPVGRVTNSEVNCVLPFIAVSKPWSCVCGREMLGLGKILGEIKCYEGCEPKSFSGRVGLPGWKTDDPEEKLKHLPFVVVRTGPVLPTFRLHSPVENTLATLLDYPIATGAMERAAEFSSLVDLVSAGLVPTSMQTLGLKQYRDALDPSKAIYQALVTCRSKYYNVRDLQFYDENDVVIRFNDVGSFHDLVKVFRDGTPKPEGSKSDVTPLAAFKFKADINYDRMRVIHEFEIRDDDGNVTRPAKSDLTATWFKPLQGFFGPRRAK